MLDNKDDFPIGGKTTQKIEKTKEEKEENKTFDELFLKPEDNEEPKPSSRPVEKKTGENEVESDFTKIEESQPKVEYPPVPLGQGQELDKKTVIDAEFKVTEEVEIAQGGKEKEKNNKKETEEKEAIKKDEETINRIISILGPSEKEQEWLKKYLEKKPNPLHELKLMAIRENNPEALKEILKEINHKKITENLQKEKEFYLSYQELTEKREKAYSELDKKPLIRRSLSAARDLLALKGLIVAGVAYKGPIKTFLAGITAGASELLPVVNAWEDWVFGDIEAGVISMGTMDKGYVVEDISRGYAAYAPLLSANMIQLGRNAYRSTFAHELELPWDKQAMRMGEKMRQYSPYQKIKESAIEKRQLELKEEQNGDK